MAPGALAGLWRPETAVVLIAAGYDPRPVHGCTGQGGHGCRQRGSFAERRAGCLIAPDGSARRQRAQLASWRGDLGVDSREFRRRRGDRRACSGRRHESPGLQQGDRGFASDGRDDGAGCMGSVRHRHRQRVGVVHCRRRPSTAFHPGQPRPCASAHHESPTAHGRHGIPGTVRRVRPRIGAGSMSDFLTEYFSS